MDSNVIILDLDDDDESQDDQIAETTRKVNVSQQQYDRIETFYHAYNENRMRKETYNELWKNLTVELNDIGPPTHSEKEWKRKWAVRKYNQKKQRSINLLNQSNDLEALGFSDQHMDQSSQSDQSLHLDQPVSDETTVDVHQQILKKLDEISSKEDVIIHYQDAVLENLLTLNNLLQSVLKKD